MDKETLFENIQRLKLAVITLLNGYSALLSVAVLLVLSVLYFTFC